MKRNHNEADRIGEMLVAAGVVTQDQLGEAVVKQRAGDARPLGELLVVLGHATTEGIELVLLRQRARRGELAPAEGLRLLDRAEACTRRTAECIDELTAAAIELGSKAR
jgi:hypothetical protein